MYLVRPAKPEEGPVHRNSETSPIFLHPGSHWDMCTNHHDGDSNSKPIMVVNIYWIAM